MNVSCFEPIGLPDCESGVSIVGKRPDFAGSVRLTEPLAAQSQVSFFASTWSPGLSVLANAR